jgi:PRTRC genetic system protein B
MMLRNETIRPDYRAPAAAALADAALYFVEGQYLFHTRDDRDEEVKYLSPAALRQAFVLEPVDSGWLKAEIVRWGVSSRGEYIVSYYAPARYKLLVRGSDGASETTLTVPLPGMVFAGLGQSWYVWSVKASRFAPNLELFQAPLPNVSSTGLICFGQHRHPEVRKDGDHTAWQLFITSAFNAHHADGKSHEYPQNILFRLYSLSANKAARYPLKDLVSLHCTVTEALRMLIER